MDCGTNRWHTASWGRLNGESNFRVHLVPRSGSILGYPWRQRDTWPHEPCWIGGPKAGDSRPANRKGLKGMMHEVDVTRCYTGSMWACLCGVGPPPPKATPPHRPMSHPHLMTHNIPHQPSVKIYTNIQPHPRHCTPTARGAMRHVALGEFLGPHSVGFCADRVGRVFLTSTAAQGRVTSPWCGGETGGGSPPG